MSGNSLLENISLGPGFFSGVTPEYVDVSATGPAKINDYEAMGYEVIVLTD